MSVKGMKAIAGGFVGLALMTTTMLAGADTVVGLRSAKLVERQHTISMTLSEGYATMVVRRTVFNGGERHDQATFDIDVPEGAVATGLRTLGALNGAAKWFTGELMEAEAAAEKYRELTGIGGYYPKDPALLSWRTQELLKLQVFPCAPNQPKTIEYTFTVPTQYRGGRHHYLLPAMGTDKLSAMLTVRASAGAGGVFVDDKRLASHKPIKLDKAIDVSLAPRRADLLSGAVASVKIDDDTTLSRYRIQTAAELSKIPRGAHIVILLDHSISIHSNTATAQLAAAQGYLSHFKDARVRVLSFDREVHEHQTRFVSAKRAAKDLAKITVTRRNGSDVSRALMAAESMLAKVGKNRPKRILLLTDSRTRSSLDEDQIRASLGTTDAIVHLGQVTQGLDAELAVAEVHACDNAIRSTGGLAWHLSSPSIVDAELRKTVLEWARPTRLRNVSIGAPHAPLFNGGFDDGELVEGEGFSQVWLQSKALPYVKIEGELWAKRVRRVLRPDKRTSDRWSALAFGADVAHELDDEQMMVLAKRGKAVSPVTSYLAIEPGVRPSTEGLEHGGSGEGIGLGSIGTIGHGSGVGRRVSAFDATAFLGHALSSAWKACGAKGKTSLTIETTFEEIVDVRDVSPDTSGDDAHRGCLRKAAWQLMLPNDFNRQLASFHVIVTP
jgi:hypothetical protein